MTLSNETIELIENYCRTNWAKATKQSQEDADYIQDVAINAMKQCLTNKAILASVKGEEWVRVKDKLPESGENVLCFHLEYGIGIGYCIPLDGSFAATYHGVPVISYKEVTHWQPLPAPPKTK